MGGEGEGGGGGARRGRAGEGEALVGAVGARGDLRRWLARPVPRHSGCREILGKANYMWVSDTN